MANKARRTNQTIVEELAAAIVAKITSGTAGTWTKPWDALAVTGLPRNAATGRPYSGINLLILGLDDRAIVTGDPRWCTYKQAQAAGWQVRKGERGTQVMLVKAFDIEDEDAEEDTRTVRMFRTFTVFHASQLDGIPVHSPIVWTAPERHAAADTLIDSTGATIRHHGISARYSPTTDTITLPPREVFTTTDGYYATALHELAHWTGGGTPTRVERSVVTRGPFGSAPYAREEVRAELASAIVLAELGITQPAEATDCHAYIASWVRSLDGDPREVINAVRDAQAIAGHLQAAVATQTVAAA